MMESFLLEQIIDSPTRITDTTATLLDHIWVSDQESKGVITGVSDHHMTYVKVY